MSIINALLSLPWPVLHHWWYWMIFFASTLEAFPIVWTFIPGHTVVILGGFFAKTGILNLWSVCAVSSLWAILGDFIGYLAGRRFWHDFIVKHGERFFFSEARFETAKRLIHAHTGKTIVIGRFNPLMRALVPFVAGATKVHLSTFSLYNIVGWISWAVSSILIGYVFGQSYEIAAKYVGRFVFIAIAVSVALAFLYRYMNARIHVFQKYRPHLLSLNIASLYLFSKMVEDVVDGELVTKWDTWVNTHIASLWNPALNRVMEVLTDIGSPVSLGIIATVLFVFLFRRKRYYDSLLVFLGMTGGWMLELVTKVLIARPRPEGSTLISIPMNYSFPSAHATMAIVFFSLLIALFREDIQNTGLRICFVTANILLILTVGFSRIYLNVHYLSDVLAGFGLGLFWFTFLMLTLRIAQSFLENRKTKKTIRNTRTRNR